jgi:hypothetical protein
MSLFHKLKNNPPKLTVKESPREVHFTIISAMCDNEYQISFRKQESGEYKILAHSRGIAFALSNYSMKGDYETDMRWAAEDNDWNKVVKIINSGTARVATVKSR